MKKTSDGFNIARSNLKYKEKPNKKNEQYQYLIDADRYRREVDSMLDFVGGRNSHYYYDSEQNTEDKVA